MYSSPPTTARPRRGCTLQTMTSIAHYSASGANILAAVDASIYAMATTSHVHIQVHILRAELIAHVTLKYRVAVIASRCIHDPRARGEQLALLDVVLRCIRLNWWRGNVPERV